MSDLLNYLLGKTPEAEAMAKAVRETFTTEQGTLVSYAKPSRFLSSPNPNLQRFMRVSNNLQEEDEPVQPVTVRMFAEQLNLLVRTRHVTKQMKVVSTYNPHAPLAERSKAQGQYYFMLKKPKLQAVAATYTPFVFGYYSQGFVSVDPINPALSQELQFTSTELSMILYTPYPNQQSSTQYSTADSPSILLEGSETLTVGKLNEEVQSIAKHYGNNYCFLAPSFSALPIVQALYTEQSNIFDTETDPVVDVTDKTTGKTYQSLLLF